MKTVSEKIAAYRNDEPDGRHLATKNLKRVIVAASVQNTQRNYWFTMWTVDWTTSIRKIYAAFV